MDDDYDWLLALPCPGCGQVGHLAGILWGLPDGPPEGNVVLGGCVGPDFEAIHTCTECEWTGEVDNRGQVVPTATDRVLGCLLGGAIGDALGAPVEFWPTSQIVREFPGGVRTYLASSYGDRLGLVTDDTQMTLFTLEALLHGSGDPLIAVHRAYLDWLQTQLVSGPLSDAVAGSLAAEVWLYARRAPGNTCVSALVATADGGELGAPAANDSKGCGAVMRSAPFALVPLPDAPELAMQAAALTHGHISGQVSAGALVVMLQQVLNGAALTKAVNVAIDWCDGVIGGDETADILRRAVALAASPAAPTAATVEALGGGWVGEEALAIAVYCALRFPDRDQVFDALSLAVSHGGDSDSTGAVCGHLLGALHGATALPANLADEVEGRDTIVDLVSQLLPLRTY